MAMAACGSGTAVDAGRHSGDIRLLQHAREAHSRAWLRFGWDRRESVASRSGRNVPKNRSNPAAFLRPREAASARRLGFRSQPGYVIAESEYKIALAYLTETPAKRPMPSTPVEEGYG